MAGGPNQLDKNKVASNSIQKNGRGKDAKALSTQKCLDEAGKRLQEGDGNELDWGENLEPGKFPHGKDDFRSNFPKFTVIPGLFRRTFNLDSLGH